MPKWLDSIIGFLIGAWVPILIIIGLITIGLIILWCLSQEFKIWAWRIVEIFWLPLLVFATPVLLAFLGGKLVPPAEVGDVRARVLEILHIIETTLPITDSAGKSQYVHNGIVVAKQEKDWEYILYYDGNTELAKVLLTLSARERQILEIRYFDNSGHHFLTDYFNVTGHTEYAEYDRGRSQNWRPILYPMPFVVPVPVFVY